MQKKLTLSLKNQEINIIRAFGDKKEVKGEIAMQRNLYQFLESMPHRNQSITLSLPDKGCEKYENEQYSNAL
jgi:hypothetical protein